MTQNKEKNEDKLTVSQEGVDPVTVKLHLFSLEYSSFKEGS